MVEKGAIRLNTLRIAMLYSGTNERVNGPKQTANVMLQTTANQWTFLAMVYNNSQMVLYVNGVKGTPVPMSGNYTFSSALFISSQYAPIIAPH